MEWKERFLELYREYLKLMDMYNNFNLSPTLREESQEKARAQYEKLVTLVVTELQRNTEGAHEVAMHVDALLLSDPQWQRQPGQLAGPVSHRRFWRDVVVKAVSGRVPVATILPGIAC